MIKLYTGPMFSGKSDELLKEYDKKYHKSKILLFKPKIDTRDYGVIKTRNGKEVTAILINNLNDIYNYLNDKITTIFIDEANFMKGNIDVLIDLSINKDLDIFIAGLNLTSELKPFGIMPELLARAEFVTKLSACCKVCGQGATRTQRIINGKPAYYEDPIILVGANESYEARCRKHHEVPHKSK